MLAIHILEKSPWFVSGLRRAFPESSRQILYRDNAQDFVELMNRSPDALAIVDLDSLADEGIAVISSLMDSTRNNQIILLVNRTQKTIIWEVMQAGCLCYLEKPVSIRILSELCLRIYDRTTLDQPPCIE